MHGKVRNLELASARFDGLVIRPGETVSSIVYNDVDLCFRNETDITSEHGTAVDPRVAEEQEPRFWRSSRRPVKSPSGS